MQPSFPRTRALAAAAALLALPASLSACGGDGASSDATAATPPPRAAHYLAPADLRRELANGFAAGLDRLAVMSQPADDAADLGQDVPTGTVGEVRCADAAPKPATTAEAWRWACSVGWQTVAGAPRTTRYDVRLFPTGCFAAGATPRYPAHIDTTIKTRSEHPLNAIVSLRRGC